MNIVFMGTPEFSVVILKKLHTEYGVNLVVTQPDKLVGRKKVLTYSPVKKKALELGINIFQPRKIKDDFQVVLDSKPDIIITAAYGQLIPREILGYPRLGCINIHGSLLPLLRGGAPIQRAIKRMHNTTGITIMYMAMKMDSGDIITQKSIPILKDDTTGILFNKLSYLGRDLLMDTLPMIIEGTNERRVQDMNNVTYAYNLKREEEKIDWNLQKEEIDAHVRAFTPNPTCYTTIDDKEIKILKVETCGSHDNSAISHLENGTIFILLENAIGVKVPGGVIKILEVQLAGKNPQDVKTFLQGAGRNLIKVDKVFK